MELDKNLLKACRDKGITITQLSRLTGVKQPTLHGWTTGRGVKNIEDLRKVCEFLNISLYQILFSKSDPNEKADVEMILQEVFKGEIRIIIQKAI